MIDARELTRTNLRDCFGTFNTVTLNNCIKYSVQNICSRLIPAKGTRGTLETTDQFD